MFENPKRGREAKNFTTNVSKILDLKSSSEQIFSENCRWVPPFTVADFFALEAMFTTTEETDVALSLFCDFGIFSQDQFCV